MAINNATNTIPQLYTFNNAIPFGMFVIFPLIHRNSL